MLHARVRADRLVGRIQWDDVTGGSNGIVGVWPAHWLDEKTAYFWFTLAIVGHGARIDRLDCARAVRLCAARVPRLAAARRGDRHRRRRTQWLAFAIAGGASAGLAGGLYAFSKGSISPETLAIPRSVDALVWCCWAGSTRSPARCWALRRSRGLADTLARATEYWRAVLGAAILLIVIAFSGGHGRRGATPSSRARPMSDDRNRPEPATACCA
jgi:branched-chain amino acid transport system permease protein